MRWHAVACGLFLFTALTVRGAGSNCSTCHPRETEAHTHTRMAHAMMPASESAFAQNVPNQPLHESGGGFLFTFSRTEKGLVMTAYRGLNTSEGLIEWVLGAGA